MERREAYDGVVKSALGCTNTLERTLPLGHCIFESQYLYERRSYNNAHTEHHFFIATELNHQLIREEIVQLRTNVLL